MRDEPSTTRSTIDHDGDPPRLALRPKEAAKALGIGARLLWSLTNQGLIPHLRLGKAIIYPVDLLRTWLADQVARGSSEKQNR